LHAHRSIIPFIDFPVSLSASLYPSIGPPFAPHTQLSPAVLYPIRRIAHAICIVPLTTSLCSTTAHPPLSTHPLRPRRFLVSRWRPLSGGRRSQKQQSWQGSLSSCGSAGSCSTSSNSVGNISGSSRIGGIWLVSPSRGQQNRQWRCCKSKPQTHSIAEHIAQHNI
jgi:hypothetical protein